MVLSAGTEEMGRGGDPGTRMRAYFELELTDIHKMIPEEEHEFT